MFSSYPKKVVLLSKGLGILLFNIYAQTVLKVLIPATLQFSFSLSNFRNK